MSVLKSSTTGGVNVKAEAAKLQKKVLSLFFFCLVSSGYVTIQVYNILVRQHSYFSGREQTLENPDENTIAVVDTNAPRLGLGNTNLAVADPYRGTTEASSRSRSRPTPETATPWNAQSAWDTAIFEAEEQLSKEKIPLYKSKKGYDIPPCLRPNKEKTSALVRKLLDANANTNTNTDANANKPLLPLPIINVGLPKSGSTTLYQFFKCLGLRSTHYYFDTPFFEGKCMREAVNNGLPPLRTCGPNTDAFMEINIEKARGFLCDHTLCKKGTGLWSAEQDDDCVFPQLVYLEEIHADNPNATFVMSMRPVHDWLRSVRDWNHLLPALVACDFPNLPRGVPEDVHNHKKVLPHMSRFLCSHFQHVRNFVRAHPSHALIELDLYDEDHAKNVMSALFPLVKSQKQNTTTTSSSESCYGHANKSGPKRKPTKQKPGRQKVNKTQ